MAKKLYHLPLKRVHTFLEKEQSTLRSNIQNRQKLEYTKRFGKASYLLEIERFICFLKVDKNLDHALKLIRYFEREKFLNELVDLMHLKSFCEGKREHLYLVLQHLKEYEPELFSLFLGQCFMHFHTQVS